MKTIFRIITFIFIILISLYLFLTIFFYRSSLLAAIRIRVFIFLSLSLVSFLIINILIIKFKIFKKTELFFSKTHFVIFLILISINTLYFTFTEVRFRIVKKYVLNTDIKILQELGQHFIIGFSNDNEIKMLAEKACITGVYFSQRNNYNKTVKELKLYTDELQKLYKKNSILPLLITADQEGGLVSHLSPPLPYQTSLSNIIGSTPYENLESKKYKVIQYADKKGKNLIKVGINLNFSPILDLKSKNEGIDFFSKIDKRAISENPLIVAKTASWYCDTLYENKIASALKHFPGLGDTKNDSHFFNAVSVKSLYELETNDWIPFKKILTENKHNIILMLGHVINKNVDQENPATLSKKITYDIIRKEWGYKGVIITDDFSMFPIYFKGIGKCSKTALENGVDIILISYDSDLFYEAMFKLIRYKKKKQLNIKQLVISKKRIRALKESIN